GRQWKGVRGVGDRLRGAGLGDGELGFVLRLGGGQRFPARATRAARARAPIVRAVLRGGAEVAEQRGLDVVVDRRVVAQVLGRVLDRLAQAARRVVAVDPPVFRPVVDHALPAGL